MYYPRSIPFCVAALTLGLYCRPAAAQVPPGGKKIEGAVIVFDARSQSYKSEPHDLSANKPVTLVVMNINTFREKYTAKLGTEDRHNLSVPSALGSLVLTKPPTFGGAVEAVRGVLPDELKDSYGKVQADIAAYSDEFKTLNVDSTEIFSAMNDGETNFAIRKEVVELIHTGTPGAEAAKTTLYGMVNTPLPDDTEDDVSQFTAQAPAIKTVAKAIGEDSIALLKAKRDAIHASQDIWAIAAQNYEDAHVGVEDAVTKAAADAKTKHAALAEMQAKVALGIATAGDFTAATSAAQAADQLLAKLKQNNHEYQNVMNAVAGVNKDRNAADSTFTDFSTNRVFLQKLYGIFLNPLLIPTHITKRLETIRADVITPSVQVDQALSTLLLPADKTTSDQTKTLAAGDVTFSTRTYTTSRPVYGRIVLDFSAGAAWTNLQQKTYYISPNPNNSALKGVREGVQDRGNVGPAVLAHLYPTTRFPLGLTGGVCLGVAATDPARYLAGLSVVTHFNRVRLMYSFGIAYGKQNTLNGDILNGDLMDPAVPPLGNSPSVASVYRRGRFNALTLSFSF